MTNTAYNMNTQNVYINTELINKCTHQQVITRGDIYYANISGNVGSVQGKSRPVLIVQNDIGNKYSPTVIALPLTTQHKRYMPTHVYISGYGLKKPSVIMAEQILTIDKSQLTSFIGHINSENVMREVSNAMCVAVAIN